MKARSKLRRLTARVSVRPDSSEDGNAAQRAEGRQSGAQSRENEPVVPGRRALMRSRTLALRASAPTLMGSDGTAGTRSVQVWAPSSSRIGIGHAGRMIFLNAIFAGEMAFIGGAHPAVFWLLCLAIMPAMALVKPRRAVRVVTDAKGFAISGVRGACAARWSEVTRLSIQTSYVFPPPYLKIELGARGDRAIRIPLRAFSREKIHALAALIVARAGLQPVECTNSIYERAV